MEKVVYALWRDPARSLADWSDDLRHGTAHALVDRGARGLQVNVADEAVAAASMRFATLDPQMEAVAGVWLDSARDAARRPLDEALAGTGGTTRVEAWSVTESEPLRDTAHRVPAGERTPGFANLAFLRRPAGMAPSDWLAAWLDGHTRVAIDVQSTFGYVQNVVVRPLTPGAPAVDGIVEELFPSAALDDLHAFFDARDDADLTRRMELMADSVGAFGADRDLDLLPTSRYVILSPWV